ncbi:polycomb protein Su(z)12 isoform X1 [Lucilia sericata]|uniref:polycomb protein Su(z)12 isoform X1 n=1 Tax=Lucilia sericata TaxID=13632 RepID=UPI0018A7EB8E|nr:polycomb protein Su(z)12 isoform X1 [Lucilia sericata]
MKKMPPQKKREKETKDAVASAAALNGNNNNNNNNSNHNNNSTLVDNKQQQQQNAINGNSAEAMTGIGTNTVATAASAAAEQTKLNSHQQEQELFLQAFEKPTQIYRFLRNRHGTSPIFLQRTLSYMKERMSRTHRKRNNFKINTMLDVLTQKSQTLSNNYLNIIYNGLFEKAASGEHAWQAGDKVTVESTLYKITKSKRKDSTSDFQEILTYSSSVIYNPVDTMQQFTAISIPAQSIHPLGDQHTIYKLLFRIKVKPAGQDEVIANGGHEDTPTKRSKLATKLYGCELIVYEKNSGCIPEGDYEAALQELNSSSIKSFSPKKRSWETLPDNYIPITMKFDVFSQYPTLKFRLTWSANELPKEISLTEMDTYCTFNDLTHGIDCENTNTTNNNDQINHNNNCLKTATNMSTSSTATTKNNGKSNNNNTTTISKPLAKTEKIQIVYNFLYSNNTRQQTEYTQEVICPWCGLDCMRLYSLLKHLKLCHARFNFTYQPAAQNGARIDVTINDSYDGSYAGSPYDLAGPSGCSFARTCGPVRRTSVTNLLVCRPRRQKTCLDEFLVLDEDDLSNQRPYITGHNRLYHHTETCLPVHPKELDIDSEGESDPLWLRQKTIQMIDEFTDVNEGEKELMKLWNLHVMKHGYVGDCQLPLACEMFLDANGHEIIRKNIYRNFILHMCSLFDYGLVSPETLYKTVQKLQGILSKYRDGQEMMSKQREAQLKYWLEVGIHKQDEQKLKSPQKPVAPTITNANNAVAESKGDKANDAKNSMQPPSKRSSSAVKRSSVNANGGSVNGAAGEKLSNGKSVARKSATQEDDAKDKSNSLKRTANGDRKSEAKAKSEADNKTQAAKRRLSTRDIQQPASKRQRNDSNNTAHNNSNANSNNNNNNNTNNSRNMLNAKQQDSSTNANVLTGKRVATRRQSIAGLPLDNNNQHNNTKLVTGKASTGSTTHTLRTRLSVPLSNKAEKR